MLRLCILASLLYTVTAVDRSKFRTCQDASFCRRHRDKTSEPEFRVLSDSIQVNKEGRISGILHSSVAGAPHFNLNFQVFESGTARVRITEKNDMSSRWESPDIVLENNLIQTPLTIVNPSDARVTALAGSNSPRDGTTYVAYKTKDNHNNVIAIRHHPLQVDLYVDGYGGTSPAVTINERSLTYYEHRRQKSEQKSSGSNGQEGTGANAGKKIVDWGEDGKAIYEDGTHGSEEVHEQHTETTTTTNTDENGLWEENFGSHADSKPFGPTSIGVDITFPSAASVYGIPEHASSHALKATDGSESSTYNVPYRLYNLDVFEYELDNPMALYGSIPFLVAHSPRMGVSSSGATVGVFWNNPTETYVDIKKNMRSNGVGISSRWISESGAFDLFLVPGPSPKAAVSQFTQIVGTQALPPLFALGYHQCRWNYKDEADVYGVDSKFEEHAFPYDVLWLDIEHTDGKRYFTWDSNLFPNPVAMQEKLASRGHKMVTIIDPHIKRDGGWKFHQEATSRGLYIKNKDGTDYDGWCWPGSSSYLDFTNKVTREFWSDNFAYDKYIGSSPSLYTWNDMNEPSVFNGPEVSMHKDAKSIDGIEHREWHNLYGLYQMMATAEGQIRRTPDHNSRSFVLSRAFYAGTQRYGAIWTGDNAAKWEHLQIASPMLLTIGVAGLTFSGADVGGFFQNPTTELMVRWYQAGSWQPFFRAHAHIDTARREPWLFGDEVLTQLRDIVRTRYTYLPLWYTIFWIANQTGVPTMRPLWMEFPNDASVLTMDDEWMVGDAILIKPVTSQGQTSTNVYFPGISTVWYDIDTYSKYESGGTRSVTAPLNKVPAFQKGGVIVPRQMRPRRSSALMREDPYTLVVTLSKDKTASGQLYLDDGITFDYLRKGSYRLRSFEYTSGTTHTLRSSSAGGSKAFAPSNTVERIVIAGIGKEPKSITATVDASGSSKPLAFTYDSAADTLSIRKPEVKIAYDWSIQLSF